MDIDQELIDLYDAYTHGDIDRRVFMTRFTAAAGSAALAALALPLIQANPASAAIVSDDDPRLASERVSYAGPDGDVLAYLVEPKTGGDLASIIVIHENRGLNAHIEDVTRRVALAGYRALGLDLLSPLGGTPADPDAARAMFRGLDRNVLVGNVLAAMTFLGQQSGATGKTGIVGFCWGGGIVGDIAARAPNLDAGVVFYGRAPELALVPDIEAELLMHYAALDDRINGTVFPQFIDALETAGKNFTTHIYEGAQHAFHNDTSAARYKEDAAMLAWERSIAFFDRTLKG